MDIYKAIVDLVNDNISALNGKLYPITADPNPTAPYATYQTINTENIKTHDGYTGGTIEQIQFDLFVVKYSDLITLKTAFIDLLKNLQGEYSGINIQSVTILNDFDGYDERSSLESITKLKRRIIELEFYY